MRHKRERFFSVRKRLFESLPCGQVIQGGSRSVIPIHIKITIGSRWCRRSQDGRRPITDCIRRRIQGTGSYHRKHLNGNRIRCNRSTSIHGRCGELKCCGGLQYHRIENRSVLAWKGRALRFPLPSELHACRGRNYQFQGRRLRPEADWYIIADEFKITTGA